MRKRLRVFLLSVFLVLPTGAHSLAQGSLRVAIDMEGDHESTWRGRSVTEHTEPGVSVALEVSTTRTRDVEAGVGVEYQVPRELKDDPDEEFNFIPLYVYGKMYTGSRGSSAFISGRFGFNLYKGNSDYEGGADGLDSGLYYAVGFGLVLSRGKHFEFMYAVNNGTKDYDPDDVDDENSRLSIAFSMAF